MNQRTLKEIQALINAAYANGNGYDGAARWYSQQHPGESFNSLVNERNRLQQNPVQPPPRAPFNSQMTWTAPITRVTAPPWPEEQTQVVMDIPVDQNVLREGEQLPYSPARLGNWPEQLSERMGDGPEMERLRQLAEAFNRDAIAGLPTAPVYVSKKPTGRQYSQNIPAPIYIPKPKPAPIYTQKPKPASSSDKKKEHIVNKIFAAFGGFGRFGGFGGGRSGSGGAGGGF